MEIRNQGTGRNPALEAFEAARGELQRASRGRVQEARAELERLTRLSHEGTDSIEITRPHELREANQIHEARLAHHEGADSVELSDRGRALAEGTDPHHGRAEAARLQHREHRAARIAAIREELQSGTFHRPERLHRAAEAMLHGPHHHEGHESQAHEGHEAHEG